MIIIVKTNETGSMLEQYVFPDEWFSAIRNILIGLTMIVDKLKK